MIGPLKNDARPGLMERRKLAQGQSRKRLRRAQHNGPVVHWMGRFVLLAATLGFGEPDFSLEAVAAELILAYAR